MNCIKILKDEDFGLESKEFNNPRVRIGARGIIIREDGKIAIFNKSNKNEYKLPGGGVDEGEDIKEAFIREALEETGCEIEIVNELGTIEEHKSLDNFKQISYIFVGKVINDNGRLNLTQKEKDEGARLLWVTPSKGLKLITDCIKNLKESKYENLYHSKFIVLRDKYILEYYMNYNKNNNKWDKLYKRYIKDEYKNIDKYFKIKMKLKKPFLKEVMKYSKNNKPILECGCGTAKTSIYLAMNDKKTYAMDIEEKMVNSAKKLSKNFCSKNLVNIFRCDIEKIPYDDKFFSVTHSSGVLEHYSDDEIIKYLNEQIRVSDYCIFSVPTTYFDKKMLGNERFLSKRYWIKIISKSNAELLKITGYNYKTLDKRIIDILKNPKKIFRPKALYTFVLKEREE